MAAFTKPIRPQQGRKVFTLQTIPAWEEENRFALVAKLVGFNLHAGVAAEAWNDRSWRDYVDMGQDQRR